jgi:hypothetical protein
MAAAVADFDLDGSPDIFVTNDRIFNYYFYNLKNGSFEERAFERGVAAPLSGDPPSAMGADAQDYDNDGRPDLIYTALRDETFPLYRNTAGEFEDAGLSSRMAVLTRPMAGWGVAFADLDNDGWKDVVAARSDALSATGPRGASAKEPLAWFRNVDGKRFAAGDELPAPAEMHRGLVVADFDNDGCLDVAVTALNAPARILRHTCSGNWLKVDVRLPGARVRVGDQWRQAASTTSGYASSCACPLHFGLGSKAAVDVEVIPPKGNSRFYKGVRANQTLRGEAAVPPFVPERPPK